MSLFVGFCLFPSPSLVFFVREISPLTTTGFLHPFQALLVPCPMCRFFPDCRGYSFLLSAVPSLQPPPPLFVCPPNTQVPRMVRFFLSASWPVSPQASMAFYQCDSEEGFGLVFFPPRLFSYAPSALLLLRHFLRLDVFFLARS